MLTMTMLRLCCPCVKKELRIFISNGGGKVAAAIAFDIYATLKSTLKGVGGDANYMIHLTILDFKRIVGHDNHDNRN